MELLINAILAPIAAVALLSIDGVAQPKRSAALVLALFVAASATRYALVRPAR
jgi:hypothetical protein